MAKSKLHPLAKKAGFKSNEDFYKKYPTKEHYEMAMGGTPKVFPQIQSEKQFFSPMYANVPAPYQNGSFQDGGFPVAPLVRDPYVRPEYPFGDQRHYLAAHPAQGMKEDLMDFANPQSWFGSGAGQAGMGFLANLGKKGALGAKAEKKLIETLAAQIEPKGLKKLPGKGMKGATKASNDPTWNYLSGQSNYMPKGVGLGSKDMRNILLGAAGASSLAGAMSYLDYSSKQKKQKGGSPGEVFHAAAAPRFKAKNGIQVDFNNPNYLLEKQKNLLSYLKNTSSSVINQKMMNQHMMPDGSMMSNSNMKAQFGAVNLNPFKTYTSSDPSISQAATYNGRNVMQYEPDMGATKKQAGIFDIFKPTSAVMNGQRYVDPGEERGIRREGDNQGLFDLSDIFGDSETSPSIDSPRFMSKYGGTGYSEMFPYAMPYQYAGGGENWIKGAVNPAHKGYCTPMSKSTCTPSRKAFARRAKAHFKAEGGEQIEGMSEQEWKSYILGNDDGRRMAEDAGYTPEQFVDAYPTPDAYIQEQTANQQQTAEQYGVTEDTGAPAMDEDAEGYNAYQRFGGTRRLADGGEDDFNYTAMNPNAMNNINMYGQYANSIQADPLSAGLDALGNFGRFSQQMNTSDSGQDQSTEQGVQGVDYNFDMRKFGGIPRAQNGITYAQMPDPASTYGTTITAPDTNATNSVFPDFALGIAAPMLIEKALTKPVSKAYIPKQIKSKDTKTGYSTVDKLYSEYNSAKSEAKRMEIAKQIVGLLENEFSGDTFAADAARVMIGKTTFDDPKLNIYSNLSQFIKDSKEKKKEDYLKKLDKMKEILNKKTIGLLPSERGPIDKAMQSLFSEMSKVRESAPQEDYAEPWNSNKQSAPVVVPQQVPLPIVNDTIRDMSPAQLDSIMGFRYGGGYLPKAELGYSMKDGKYYYDDGKGKVYPIDKAQYDRGMAKSNTNTLPGVGGYTRPGNTAVSAPVASTAPVAPGTPVTNNTKANTDAAQEEVKGKGKGVPKTQKEIKGNVISGNDTVPDYKSEYEKIKQEYDTLKNTTTSTTTTGTTGTYAGQTGSGNYGNYGYSGGYGYPYKVKNRVKIYGDVYGQPGTYGNAQNTRVPQVSGMDMDALKKYYADRNIDFSGKIKNDLIGRIFGLPPKKVKWHMKSMKNNGSPTAPISSASTVPPGPINYYGRNTGNPSDDANYTEHQKAVIGNYANALKPNYVPDESLFGHEAVGVNTGMAPYAYGGYLPMAQEGNTPFGTGMDYGIPSGPSSNGNPLDIPDFDWRHKEKRVGIPGAQPLALGIIGTMDFANNIANIKPKNRAAQMLNDQFAADVMFNTQTSSPKGQWSENEGYQFANRLDTGWKGNTFPSKFGGSYEDGSIYDLSQSEIDEILRNGGTIEYID